MPGWKSEVKDPGEYEPNAHRDMSALAKHSFSRSGSAGTMDFGGKSARKMKLDILGGDGRDGITPEPGHYGSDGGGGKLPMTEAANQMKSSVFHSASAQRVNPAAKDDHNKPAVGQYNPDDSLTVPKVVNACQSMASNSDRFSSSMLFDRSHTTGPELGPGSHKPLSNANGNRATVAGAVASQKAKGKNASFRSESVRDLNSAFFANEKIGF